MKKKYRHYALGAALGAVGVYAGMLSLLYFQQDKLIFQGEKENPLSTLFMERFGKNAHPYVLEEQGYPTLRGWHIRPDNAKDVILVYFGGNAEHIDSVIFLSSNLPEYEFLSLHYRGYGLSEGEPSELSLLDDASRLLKKLHTDYPNKKIVLLGRSLGSGIAIKMAAKHPDIVNSVVLTTPYDSIENVAARHYKWVPVRSLLRHKFNSLQDAGNVKQPVTIIVGALDTYIPQEHAMHLRNALTKSDVQWCVVDPADHRNIHDWNQTWVCVKDHLTKHT